jgi:hypothetical protein
MINAATTTEVKIPPGQPAKGWNRSSAGKRLRHLSAATGADDRLSERAV